MKVLITGCTAQQASARAAERYPTSAALMKHALESQNVEVKFSEPSIEMDQDYLSEYDLVLLGIAPPTALGASRLYSAFSVGNKALKNGNLAFFLDSPEPHKVYAGIKSCASDPKRLAKSFYSARKGYKEYVSDPRVERDVNSFLYYLHNGQWPYTFYTALPWSYPDEIQKDIPNIAIDRILPMNFDSIILTASGQADPLVNETPDYFVSETLNTPWIRRARKQILSNVISAKQSKWDDVHSVQMRIKKSLGTIAPLYRSDHAWWTATVPLSLGLGVPVITDWKKSKHLGESWTFLPSAVESLTGEERALLASQQAEDYRKTVVKEPSKFVENLNLAKTVDPV